MIDLTKERPITLRSASELIPNRRVGRPTHPTTIARWIHDGMRGVRLDGIRVGASLCTSVEALQRFFDELTRLGVPAGGSRQEVAK